MTSASITRIPNEAHMALVRDARRRAGLWLPTAAILSAETRKDRSGSHGREVA